MRWFAAIVSIAFVIEMLRIGEPHSSGDGTGQSLSRRRVQAGMLIGLLAAVQSLGSGVQGVHTRRDWCGRRLWVFRSGNGDGNRVDQVKLFTIRLAAAAACSSATLRLRARPEWRRQTASLEGHRRSNSTAYLFGSIHFAREDMYPLDPVVTAAFDESDTSGRRNRHREGRSRPRCKRS